MKKENLYPIWGILFVLSAGLGFVPAEGGLRWLLTGVSLLFFVPPVLILREARKSGSARDRKLIRNLAAASLGVTVAVLLLSILSAVHSEAVGNFFHVLLVIVSAPMMCSGYWALSLFLWACLLIAAIRK